MLSAVGSNMVNKCTFFSWKGSAGWLRHVSHFIFQLFISKYLRDMHNDHNINKLNICQNGGIANTKCKREENQETTDTPHRATYKNVKNQ